MKQIKMTMGAVELNVELFDTPTAATIYEAAPFEGIAQTWGDEVYFNTEIFADAEPDARDVMEPGEIAFWLAGGCIAIPFGPTPISQGDELRLASAANVWGRAVQDVKSLAAVQSGDNITVERVD